MNWPYLIDEMLSDVIRAAPLHEASPDRKRLIDRVEKHRAQIVEALQKKTDSR
jgi:hypothetical protein